MAAPKQIKIDLRKQIRALATEAQDEMLARFIRGVDLHGAPLDPLDDDTIEQRGRARRKVVSRTTLGAKRAIRRGLTPGERVKIKLKLKKIGPDVTKRGKVKKGTRINVSGVRHTIERRTPGVDSGEMLRSVKRRSNRKVNRTGYLLTAASGQKGKWMSFNLGSKDETQPRRHVGGLTTEYHRRSAARIAEAFRGEIVRQMNQITRANGLLAGRRALADYARRQAKAVRIAQMSIGAKIDGYKRGEFTKIRRNGYFQVYPKGGTVGGGSFNSPLRPVN